MVELTSPLECVVLRRKPLSQTEMLTRSLHAHISDHAFPCGAKPH
jgi:hypothetical protein